MGVRFRKSVSLGKGVKLNLGKGSVGVSLGGKRGGVSFNSRTGARARASVPGSGISYSTGIGGGKGRVKDFDELAAGGNEENRSGGLALGKLLLIIASGILVFFLALSSCGGHEEAHVETPSMAERIAALTPVPAPTADQLPAENEQTAAVEQISVETGENGQVSAEAGQELVWISQNGSKYHSRSGCSGMEDPVQLTLDEALSRGYTACKKCN